MHLLSVNDASQSQEKLTGTVNTCKTVMRDDLSKNGAS